MFNSLLRQINTYTDRSERPSKYSPIFEQYEKCEKAIDHQVGKMKNILKHDLSLNDIEKKFDPEIVKNCNPWFSKIDSKIWYEYGNNCDGSITGFKDNICKYIKDHGYLNKYDLDTTKWYLNHEIIMYPNDNDTIRINANILRPKIILNPIYRHIDHDGGKFHMEITNNNIEPVVRMYRYKEISYYYD